MQDVSTPAIPVSPVHIWRELTGGGLPVEFLKWLAAQWEMWGGTTDEGREARWLRDDHPGDYRANRQDILGAFSEWLCARHAAFWRPDET